MLTDRDAISLMLEYYGQRFTARDTANLVTLLCKTDVVELIQHAYRQGVLDTRGDFETLADIKDYWRHQCSGAE